MLTENGPNISYHPDEGNANNVVEAAFEAMVGLPASFTASGRTPGNPALTSISGVVLDNSNVPIAGVTIRAVLTSALRSSLTSVQSALAVTTDDEGQFSIPQAPVGLVKLLVDGTTAGSTDEPRRIYPSLEYDIVTGVGAGQYSRPADFPSTADHGQSALRQQRPPVAARSLSLRRLAFH